MNKEVITDDFFENLAYPHNRLLLHKLHSCGIQNTTHTWISSFLKKRTQTVVVSCEKSAWTEVISGVPLGTVLGLLLFLTYINDLPQNLQSSSAFLLMTVSFTVKSSMTLIPKFSREILIYLVLGNESSK